MIQVPQSLPTTDLSTQPTHSLELPTLHQAAQLTLRILATLDLDALRFDDRQRLAPLLIRLEKVAGDVHELITLPSR